MPRIIETTVYTIDELSGAAKENARIWYRDQGLHDEWYDFVYEDFETICKILGVTLATTPVRLYGGGTRDKPQVWFSGFLESGRRRELRRPLQPRQGSRQGHPRPRAEGRRAAPDRGRVAGGSTQELLASPCLASASRGRYCHEYTMAIEVERDSPTWQPMTDGAEDAVIEALRDLARWLYRQLRSEYEHQTSDDAVDEIVQANPGRLPRTASVRLIRPA